MFEASKAVMRRLHDSRFVTRYFVGDGIDIGAGPDSLVQYAEQFPLRRSCRDWDLGDGDAQMLSTVADNSLDFVHSSHCLEHMRDPREALHHWLRVLKPGGHLIVIIPDEDLYEQGIFPSTFNIDHKLTFTMHKARSWSPNSVNLMGLLSEFADRAQTIKVEQLDATFRFRQPRRDQTHTPIGECALEFILRKLPAEELARRGRYPDASAASPLAIGSAPRELAPIGIPLPEDELSLAKVLQKHRWKFVLGAAAVSLMLNLNRYFGFSEPSERIAIARTVAEVVGYMLLGYAAWWVWAKAKRISLMLRPRARE
jgi:SAM-dependent methyltransferase